MNKKPVPFLALTRLNSSLPVTLYSSLLGAVASQSEPAWSLLYVIIANIFCSWFFFILRDLQYAAIDFSNPDKNFQNPIAAGTMSQKAAQLILLGLASIIIALYALSGTESLLTGLVLLGIIILLNWRKLGLQKAFYLKVSAWHWLVNGFFCLLAHLSLNKYPGQISILTIVFVMLVLLFFTITEHSQHPESKETLKKLNLASAIILTLSIIIATALFFFFRILPYWVLGLFATLLTIMLVPQVLERKRANQKPFLTTDFLKRAFFNAGSLSLMVHFLIPLIYPFFKK